MRDQRKIVIKDSKLRNIRNSFRKIIFLKLNDLLSETNMNGPVWWSLMRPFKQSICCCSICDAIDEDMVYNAGYNSWNCISCNSIFFKDSLNQT